MSLLHTKEMPHGRRVGSMVLCRPAQRTGKTLQADEEQGWMPHLTIGGLTGPRDGPADAGVLHTDARAARRARARVGLVIRATHVVLTSIVALAQRRRARRRVARAWRMACGSKSFHVSPTR